MINDEARNRAFSMAIKERASEIACDGEWRGIDLGCGSGLLSMMMMQSGAQHVTACDNNAHLAEVARDVLRKNGFKYGRKPGKVSLLPADESYCYCYYYYENS